MWTAKTRAILRSMLDPDSKKTSTVRTIRTLAGECKSDSRTLTEAPKDKYMQGGGDSIEAFSCERPLNNAIDEPTTVAEFYAAARDNWRNTTPEKEFSANAMLHNLSNVLLGRLVGYFNKDIWEKDAIRQLWKEATIVVILKLGKQRSIDNLKPLSLTACFRKLFINATLVRLSDCIKRRNVLSVYIYAISQTSVNKKCFP